jgi:hypothetical protein
LRKRGAGPAPPAAPLAVAVRTTAVARAGWPGRRVLKIMKAVSEPESLKTWKSESKF